MPVSVMLVDDVAEVRVLLRTALRLSAHADVVAEAATSTAANELAAITRPDLIVLDLRLPDASSREAFLRVREASPASQVVIYSVGDTDRSWYERNGAARFLLKDGDIVTLIETIESAERDR
ncbi:MAG TPA: response regulator transcription factor [Jatrophihabitans sp.]|nr:response regulator transcription factor [Jatrophihabitans sp.]